MPARLKSKTAVKSKLSALKSKKPVAVGRPKAKAATGSKTSAKIARLVIHENGTILFASPELFGTSVEGTKAQDFFSFTSPEDAMHDRPNMRGGDHSDAWVGAIIDGDHEIKITGSRTKAFSMRFDRISLPDGRIYLVAGTQTSQKAQQPDLESFVSSVVKPEIKTKMASVTSENQNAPELTTFLNMTHDLILLMDKEGGIIHANDTFRDVLGYKIGRAHV